MSVWRLALAVGLPLYVTCFGFVSGAEAATVISGSITEDTTWTASSSPYVLDGDITLDAGVTLSVDPGVIVKLRNGVDFIINGTLSALGTETEPIHFTSYQDDSIGGDTNNDGSTTVPQARDWRTIQFNNSSIGRFDYVTISYAGYFTSSQRSLPAVYNNGGQVSINNSFISDNRIYGIGQVGGSLEVRNSVLRNQDYGIVVTSGPAIIYDSEIEQHNIAGIYAGGEGNLEIFNISFTNNGIAADVSLASERSFTHNGNTASGSGLNGVVIRGPITGNVALSAGDMPYIVTATGGLSAVGAITISTDSNLKIAPTGKLEIEAGTVVKFANNSSLITDGSLTTLGTKENSVYLTSIKDDSVGGDTNDDGSVSTPAAGNWRQLQFNTGSQGNFDYTTIRYAGQRVGSDVTQSGISNNGGNLTLTNSEISNNNQNGILNNSGTVFVSASNIRDHVVYGIWNKTTEPLDARNNYWGDSSGPYHSTLNPSGLGNDVSNNVLFEPWKTFGCITDCKSSVLFLPGIQASRLYTEGTLGTEDRLWETIWSDDVSKLSMTENGQSINNIYTKDVVDVAALGTYSVYDQFLAFLEQSKAAQTISDWRAFPYDWRYDAVDVVENGTLTDLGRVYPIEVLEQMVKENNGPVTIIAHSNGGLLAKALIQKLEQEGKSNLIDRLILLASPQLGTPKTIGSLLHGYDQNITTKIRTFIKDYEMRTVSRNMSGAYGLLPSDSLMAQYDTSPVTFENVPANSSFTSAYGSSIDSINELKSFMVGTEGRVEPETSDIYAPIPANLAMINKAATLHSSLDFWTAPANIEVIEIVGTGLATVEGFHYQQFQRRDCLLDFLNCETITYSKPMPRFTTAGDATVLQKSAEAYPGEKQTYYVALQDVPTAKNIRHHNIGNLEVVQELISSLINKNNADLPQYISTSPKPADVDEFDIISVHSPVGLSLKTSDGKEIYLEDKGEYQEVINEVPAASYLEMAGGKYLVVPSDIDYEVELDGQANGYFTLRVDSLKDEVSSSISNWSLATVTPQTVIKFSKDNNVFSNLLIDLNNDSTTDEERTLDGIKVVVEPEFTYQDLIEKINNLQLKKLQKTILLTAAKLSQSFNFSKGKYPKYAVLEDSTLEALKALLKKYLKNKLISQASYDDIITVVDYLKEN